MAINTYNQHPVCATDGFLKFLTGPYGDPRYRMQLNSPWVQEVQACCEFGDNTNEPPNACQTKLDATWFDADVQARWHGLNESVNRQANYILSLTQSFGAKGLESLEDLKVQEAGVANPATLMLGGALALAFVLAFQNLQHNAAQTSNHFRDTSRPFPETATRPPRPFPADFDPTRSPDETLHPKPRETDRLPPPPIEPPRRRRDCNNQVALELTDQNGRIHDDFVSRFLGYQNNGVNEYARSFTELENRDFLPRPVSFWVYSPSQQKNIKVIVRQIPWTVARETLSAQELADAEIPALPAFIDLVILTVETEQCEVLGTSVGAIKTGYADKLAYTYLEAHRVRKLKDPTDTIERLFMITYITRLLGLKHLGYLDNNYAHPVIMGIELSLLRSVRRYLGLSGESYERPARGNPARIDEDDVSNSEALDILRELAGKVIPRKR